MSDETIISYNREILIHQPNKDKPASIRNIRESSIETMYHRKQIDALQYTAGSIFRRLKNFTLTKTMNKKYCNKMVEFF